MHRLIGENPRNGECIFPYIGARDNTTPTHSHHRYVINFRNYPLRRTNVEGHWKGAERASVETGYEMG